jgi:hypothetical protein
MAGRGIVFEPPHQSLPRRRCREEIQAGLLARGLAFPWPSHSFQTEQWLFQGSYPHTVAGPRRPCTGFPLCALFKGTRILRLSVPKFS